MSFLEGITLSGLFDLFAAATLGFGVFFMVVGAVGVLRLPDAYNRIHSASMCVTLGINFMLIAACFHVASTEVLSKTAVTIVFLLVATPVGSHLLAKAAHHGRLPQWGATISDELEEDKQSSECTVTDDPAAGFEDNVAA